MNEDEYHELYRQHKFRYTKQKKWYCQYCDLALDDYNKLPDKEKQKETEFCVKEQQKNKNRRKRISYLKKQHSRM